MGARKPNFAILRHNCVTLCPFGRVPCIPSKAEFPQIFNTVLLTPTFILLLILLVLFPTLMSTPKTPYICLCPLPLLGINANTGAKQAKLGCGGLA